MKITKAGLLAPALLVLALGLGGCSSDNDSADQSGGSSAVEAPLDSPGGASDLAGGAADGAVSDSNSAQDASVSKLAEQAPSDQVERSLIRHGNVELRSDDVGAAQFEVQKIVDRYAGQVTEEKTATNDDGKPAYTRMVLRIPADDFSKAMDDLKAVGVLRVRQHRARTTSPPR